MEFVIEVILLATMLACAIGLIVVINKRRELDKRGGSSDGGWLESKELDSLVDASTDVEEAAEPKKEEPREDVIVLYRYEDMEERKICAGCGCENWMQAKYCDVCGHEL